MTGYILFGFVLLLLSLSIFFYTELTCAPLHIDNSFPLHMITVKYKNEKEKTKITKKTTHNHRPRVGNGIRNCPLQPVLITPKVVLAFYISKALFKFFVEIFSVEVEVNLFPLLS